MVLVSARRLESRSKYKQAVRFASSMTYRLKCYFPFVLDDFACLCVYLNDILIETCLLSTPFFGTA
jgi:hypothetical protein